MKRILMLISVFVFIAFFSISAIASEKELKEGILPGWMERVSLSGTIEGDYSWSEHNDVTDKDSDSTSELFISTVELGTEVDFMDRIKGSLIFLAEDLGSHGDVRNPPGIERPYALPEELGSLEEERPLLGESDLEAGQVHALDVGLDRGEIGVDGRDR